MLVIIMGAKSLLVWNLWLQAFACKNWRAEQVYVSECQYRTSIGTKEQHGPVYQGIAYGTGTMGVKHKSGMDK